jgi:iron complex outermembrane receptor protein
MNYSDQQLSQELQAIASPWNGRLSLVGGLFYIHQKASSAQNTGPDYVDPVGYYYGNKTTNTSAAAYLQATLKITEKLSATAGVRYSHDHTKSASAVFEGCTGTYLEEYQTGEGGCWVPGPTAADWAGAGGTWTHTDPRFQLDYQWTPDLLTYLSATSGYESGGFNAQLPYLGAPYNLPYNEETVWNYEGGLKSEWLDHRLRANIAVFDQEFHNFQSSVIQYHDGVDVHTTTSAANAFERGTEVEIDAIPVQDLNIRLTYAYLDQGYSKIFPGALGLTKDTAISTAPKNAYSISADYIIHVSGGAQVVPAINWRYVGTKTQGTFPEQVQTPGYGLLGANVAYIASSGKWQVSAWARNLLDKYYYVDYSAGANTNMGLTQVVPGEPREYGLTLRYNLE